jgi:hypothetical protein
LAFRHRGNLFVQDWGGARGVETKDEGLYHSRTLSQAGRLTTAAERLIDTTPEPALVAAILAGFVVLWMLFWAVSTAPLDVPSDAGENSVWAQHFAFGYKHPPMTAWIFMCGLPSFPGKVGRPNCWR